MPALWCPSMTGAAVAMQFGSLSIAMSPAAPPPSPVALDPLPDCCGLSAGPPVDEPPSTVVSCSGRAARLRDPRRRNHVRRLRSRDPDHGRNSTPPIPEIFPNCR